MSDSINVRSYNNKEQLLFPASIGDYLNENDLAHVVDEAVEIIDLTPYYVKISAVGNPSYHPKLMIKTWFYGYAIQTCSSRKIEEKLYKDIAFIYLAGMQKPDFKAISEFRRRNIEELKKSFVEILQICHRLGMTKLGKISIDSKVMKANASKSNTYTEEDLIKEQKEIEEAIEKYMRTTEITDQQEDKEYGPDKRGNELPEDISKKEDRIKKMKQVQQKLKEAQAKLKARKEPHSRKKDRINLTDNDAQFQQDKGRKTAGYRGQVAVDTQEQVIVANDVTSDRNDVDSLVPMAEETLKNIKELKEEQNNKDNQEQEKVKILADGGYSSGSNLNELEKMENVDPYVPDREYQAKQNGRVVAEDSPFHVSKFKYNKEQNYYICPCDKILIFRGYWKNHNQTVAVYGCKECKNCKFYGKCTKDKTGRKIQVSPYADLIKNMREKLSTDEGKQIYAKRMSTVEPALGNLAHNLGFREFLLRGLEKVKGEFSLMCTAHNLKKITRFSREQKMLLTQALAKPCMIAIPDG